MSSNIVNKDNSTPQAANVPNQIAGSTTNDIPSIRLEASATTTPSSVMTKPIDSANNVNLDIGTILLISVGAGIALIIVGSIIYLYRQKRGLDDDKSVLKVNDKAKDLESSQIKQVTINHRTVSENPSSYPAAAYDYYKTPTERHETPQPDNSSDYMYPQAGDLSNFQLPNISLETAFTPIVPTNPFPAGAVAYYDPPTERHESPQPDNSSDYIHRQSEFLPNYQLPNLERSVSRHSTINHHPATASASAYYDPQLERHGSPIPHNSEYMHRHTVNLSNYQMPQPSYARSETRLPTRNQTPPYASAAHSFVEPPIERYGSPSSDYMYRHMGDQSIDPSYYRNTIELNDHLITLSDKQDKINIKGKRHYKIDLQSTPDFYLRNSVMEPNSKLQSIFKRYITVWSRTTLSNGKSVDWDIVGHSLNNPIFVTIFPFDPKTKNISALLLEYAQGPDEHLYTFPSGGIDSKKHNSPKEAATMELSEEAHLKGGKFISLLPIETNGISELKWGTNKFIPYLVIDAQNDPDPYPRDEEENIEILSQVSISDFKKLVMEGKVMLPAVQTAVMAVDYLVKNEFLERNDLL